MTATPSDLPPQSPLRQWMAKHRRQIRFGLILAAVAIVFFIIGATAPRAILPYACKVYG